MAAYLQLTAQEVAESADIQENTSQVYVKLTVTTTGGTYNHSGDTTGSVTVNGQSFSLDGAAVDKNTTTVLFEQTFTVPHNPDGTKSVTVAVRFDPNTPNTQAMTQTQTLELTAIARASTVVATDAAIGSVSMIAVNSRAEGNSHTLYWEFGELSGWLDSDGSLRDTPQTMTQTSLGFTLPESFYYQIPQSPSGVCRLVCTTYREDRQVGQPQQTTFTVTADPALCAPVGQVTVVDVDPVTVALTGDESRFVRYASTARCTLDVTARLGASIVAKTVNGVLLTGDSLEIPGFAQEQLLCTATDSRGNSWQLSVPCQLVSYIPLTANLTAGRTDPTSGRAVVQVRGSCFLGSFGARENALDILCTIGGQSQSLTAVPGTDCYQAAGEFSGLDYRLSHSVTLTVTDGVGSVTRTALIGKGVPVFHWGEEDFVFQVPVTVPDPVEDAHAVNKAYALARAGDTMTGPLAVPALELLGQENGGVQLSAGEGALCLTNRVGGVTESYTTPAATRSGSYSLLTSKEPVTLEQGGTGAADPAAARQNLGLGCTLLMEGEGSVDCHGGYGQYLVVGRPAQGASFMSLNIPAELVTEDSVRWQIADSTDYVSFYVSRSGSAVQIKKAAGNGVITALYGIN